VRAQLFAAYDDAPVRDPAAVTATLAAALGLLGLRLRLRLGILG
jgi:hypothetical protein